jgi:hypothetical protein
LAVALQPLRYGKILRNRNIVWFFQANFQT